MTLSPGAGATCYFKPEILDEVLQTVDSKVLVAGTLRRDFDGRPREIREIIEFRQIGRPSDSLSVLKLEGAYSDIKGGHSPTLGRDSWRVTRIGSTGTPVSILSICVVDTRLPMRCDAMRAILDAWENGQVTLVTSALTIPEVLWFKCGGARKRIDDSQREGIMNLFSEIRDGDNQLIIVELNRRIAEIARDLYWEHQIHPKDGVHVASALASSCPVLHTHDALLRKSSEKVGGDPPLKITLPEWNKQQELL